MLSNLDEECRVIGYRFFALQVGVGTAQYLAERIGRRQGVIESVVLALHGIGGFRSLAMEVPPGVDKSDSLEGLEVAGESERAKIAVNRIHPGVEVAGHKERLPDFGLCDLQQSIRVRPRRSPRARWDVNKPDIHGEPIEENFQPEP